MSAAIYTIHCMIKARTESLLRDENAAHKKAVLSETVELASEALEMGQAMEARLFDYRTSIEKLGFERKK